MIKLFKRWLSGAERNFLPVDTTEFTEECTSELIDFWGRTVERADRRILSHDGKRWFLKYKNLPESLYRDRLAYLLGHQWANVAEVRPLGGEQFAEISRHFGPLEKWASTSNTFLVRLAQDYKPEELVHQDLDGAVASELVFSLWVRRRDAHAANRAYVNGVPIFFDHETAFLGEPELSEIAVFFSDGSNGIPGEGAGFAGNWRVKSCRKSSIITSRGIRRLCIKQKKAPHFVHDMNRFNKGIEDSCNRILSQDSDDWYGAAREAGYESCRAREVAQFLKQNSLELEDSLIKMRDVIFRE